MNRSTLWRVLAIALPVLGALVAPLPSVDLAYQLRAGAEILDRGAIPAVDSWTFTVAGAPWLDQQWGAQVLLDVVFRLGGWTGLVLLRAGLVGLAFGLLLLVIRRRAPGIGPRSAALLVIAAFLVSVTALALRPQLFAIVLFAATLLVLAIRNDRPRVVWLIPVFAAAWANLHGTFLLAPALCGLAWLGDLAEPAAEPNAVSPTGPWRPGARRHRMLLVGLVATAATVVTPFGPGVWGYVANLASNPTIAGRVSEWQPPSPLTVSGAIVWLSIVAVGAVALVRIRRGGFPRRGSVPWASVLTLLAFGGFAAISGRGTAWWPFAAVFVVAPWLTQGRSRDLAEAPREAAGAAPHLDRTPPMLRRLNAGLVAILAIAGVALLPVWRPAGAMGLPAGTLSYAPQSLAARLDDPSVVRDVTRDIRVWNPQVWGSWLEFAAPERYKFALDSRIELFPKAVWDDADAIAAGSLDRLTQRGVTVVITDHQADGRLEAALRDSGQWVAVFHGCEGSIWLAQAPGQAISTETEVCR